MVRAGREDFLADLTNFNQINDTRMFQCRIAFITTTGIFYPGGGSATFEIDPGFTRHLV